MKALSLRQPWLWLVLYAGKWIENRKWNTFYRGPVLLHASARMTRKDYDDAQRFLDERHFDVKMPQFDDISLRRGGFLGRAMIRSVIYPGCVPSLLPPYGSCGQRWHMHEQHGFVLDNVATFEMVPWPGSLGLFNVPDDLFLPAAAS